MKEKKPKKITMKERILQFVEGRGSARFTDIQRFIVDFSGGPGLYDKGKHFEIYYTAGKMVGGKYVEGHRIVRMVNSYRGTYSANFSPYNGYLMLGNEYLEKRNKLYYTVRGGVRKTPPKRYKNQRYLNNRNRCPEEIICFPSDAGTVTGPGNINPTEQLHVNNSYPYEHIEAPGNFDDCDIKVVQIENDNDYVVESKVSEPFVTGYNKKEDLSLVFDQFGRHIDSFSGAPLPRMEKAPEQPKYCRWCGHKLHSSHFEPDNNELLPEYCQWCGHIL